MALSFMSVTPAGEFGIALNYQKYQKISHLNKSILSCWACYLLENANPIARPAIPIAEIAVRILLTNGF
jgi:hypothetical protein